MSSSYFIYSGPAVALLALGLILVAIVITLSCAVIHLLGKVEKLEKKNYLDLAEGKNGSSPLIKRKESNAGDRI